MTGTATAQTATADTTADTAAADDPGTVEERKAAAVEAAVTELVPLVGTRAACAAVGRAPNNAGPALWADIAFPIILIALLVIAWRHAPERAAHRNLRRQPS